MDGFQTVRCGLLMIIPKPGPSTPNCNGSPCCTRILQPGASTPRVTFRRVVVSLRGPGQSPVLPFACCVGSLRSVGRCGRCSSPPPDTEALCHPPPPPCMTSQGTAGRCRSPPSLAVSCSALQRLRPTLPCGDGSATARATRVSRGDSKSRRRGSTTNFVEGGHRDTLRCSALDSQRVGQTPPS